MWDLSSLTRDWTWIPCIAREILNHWTAKEVPVSLFLSLFLCNVLLTCWKTRLYDLYGFPQHVYCWLFPFGSFWCVPLSLVFSSSWQVGLFIPVCSVASDFVTPLTLALQSPLSMRLSQSLYLSWLPFPPPEDLPDPGIEPLFLASCALTGGYFTYPLGL